MNCRKKDTKIQTNICACFNAKFMDNRSKENALLIKEDIWKGR